MVCDSCRASDAALSSLTKELSQKTLALESLEAKGRKAKLQAKGRVAQLRADLEALAGGDPGHPASLALRLQETQAALDVARDDAVADRDRLQALTALDNDHRMRIKSLEEELNRANSSLVELSSLGPSSKARALIEDESKSTEDDVRKMYAQIVYKDTKILELNNELLARDREIMDLREAAREKAQVLDAKSQAITILQRQLKDSARPPSRDASVETLRVPRPTEDESAGERSARPSPAILLQAAASPPPGRAVPQLFARSGSPPPNDPAFDDGRSDLTTESAPELGESADPNLHRTSLRHLDSHLEGMLERVSSIQKSLSTEQTAGPSSSLLRQKESRKKAKKRVTFDLSQEASTSEHFDEVGREELGYLQLENEELRRSLSDLEVFLANRSDDAEAKDAQLRHSQDRIRSLEEEAEEAGARNRELESALAASKAEESRRLEQAEAAEAELADALDAAAALRAQKDAIFEDLEPLKETVATSRELIESLEAENSALRRRLDDEAHEKAELKAEADALLEQNRELLTDFDPVADSLESSTAMLESQEMMVLRLRSELSARQEEVDEAKQTAEGLLAQKQSVLDDMDALREAIESSRGVIESLESDLETANAEADVLKEELSQLRSHLDDSSSPRHEPDKARLKSKAWEAKLRHVEEERAEAVAAAAEAAHRASEQEEEMARLRRDLAAARADDDHRTHLESLLAQHKNEAEETNRELSRRRSECEALRRRVVELEASTSTEEAEQELRGHWEREAELKAHADAAQASADRLRAHRNELAQRLEEAQSVEAEMTAALTAAAEETRAHKAKAEAAHDRIKVLESGATAATIQAAGELDTVREHVLATQAENTRLAAEALELRSSSVRLEAAKTAAETEASQGRARLAAAEAEAANELAATQQEADRWRQAAQDGQAAIEDLQAEVEEVRTHLRTKADTCRDQERMLKDLADNTATLRSEKHHLAETLAQAEAELVRQKEASAGSRESSVSENAQPIVHTAEAQPGKGGETLEETKRKLGKATGTLRLVVDILKKEADFVQGPHLVDSLKTALANLTAEAKETKNLRAQIQSMTENQAPGEPSEVEVLQERIGLLEKSLNASQLELEDAKSASHYQLQVQLEASKNLLAEDIRNAEIANASLAAELETERGKVWALSAEVETLRTSKTEADENDRRVSVEMESLQAQIALLTASLSQQETMINELQSTIDGLRSANEELESNAVIKDSETAQLRARISELEVARLQASLDRTDDEERPEDDRPTPPEQVTPALQPHLDEETEQLRSDLAQAAGERDRLTADRQNLCQEILTLNTELAEARSRLDEQQTVIDGLNDSVDLLVTEIEELKATHTLPVAPSLETEPSQRGGEGEGGENGEEKEEMVPAKELETLRETWSGRVTGLEEENQLLRHCLNEAEAAATARLQQCEELELLETAQKSVIEKLRTAGSVVGELSQLRESTLTELSQHRDEVEASFGQVASHIDTAAAALETVQADKAQLQTAYTQLSDYYTQLQAAYTTLYQQYSDLSAQPTGTTLPVSTQDSQTQPSIPSSEEIPTNGANQTDLSMTVVETTHLPAKEARDAETETDSTPTVTGSSSEEVSESKKLILRLKAKVKKQQLELEEARAAPVAPPAPKECFLPVILGLKEALAELQEQRNALDDELAELRDSTTGELKRLSSELDGYAQHLATVSASGNSPNPKALVSLETEKRSLDETVRLQAEELASIKAMWYGIEAQRSTLEQENQSLRTQLASAPAQPEFPLQPQQASPEIFQPVTQPEDLERLKEDNSLLLAQLTELTEKNAGLMVELETAEQSGGDKERLLVLEASLNRSANELDELQRAKAELSQQAEALAEQGNEAENLRAQLAALEESHALQRQELEAELNEAVKAQAEGEAQQQELLQELKFIRNQQEESVQNSETTDVHAEDAPAALEEARIRNSELETQATEAKEQLASLEMQLRERNEESERLHQTITDLESRLGELETQVNDYRETAVSADALQEAQSEKTDLTHRLDQLSVEKAQAEADLQDAQDQISNLMAIASNQLQPGDAEERILSAEARAEKAEAGRRVMEEALAPLERRLEDMEERCSELEADNAQLLEELKEEKESKKRVEQEQLEKLGDVVAHSSRQEQLLEEGETEWESRVAERDAALEQTSAQVANLEVQLQEERRRLAEDENEMANQLGLDSWSALKAAVFEARTTTMDGAPVTGEPPSPVFLLRRPSQETALQQRSQLLSSQLCDMESKLTHQSLLAQQAQQDLTHAQSQYQDLISAKQQLEQDLIHEKSLREQQEKVLEECTCLVEHHQAEEAALQAKVDKLVSELEASKTETDKWRVESETTNSNLLQARQELSLVGAEKAQLVHTTTSFSSASDAAAKQAAKMEELIQARDDAVYKLTASQERLMEMEEESMQLNKDLGEATTELNLLQQKLADYEQKDAPDVAEQKKKQDSEHEQVKEELTASERREQVLNSRLQNLEHQLRGSLSLLDEEQSNADIIHEITAKNDALNQELADAKRELSKMAETQCSEVTNIELEQSQAEYEAALTKLKIESEKAKEAEIQCRKEFEGQSQTLFSVEAGTSELRIRLEAKEDDALKTAADESAEVQSKLSAAEVELYQLRTELQEMYTKEESALARATEYDAAVAALEVERSQTQNELAELRRQLKHAKEAEMRVGDEAASQSQTLQFQTNELRNQLQTKTEQVERLEEETNSRLKLAAEEYAALQSIVTEAETELSRLRQELQVANTEREQISLVQTSTASASMAAIETEKVEMKTKLSALQQKLEERREAERVAREEMAGQHLALLNQAQHYEAQLAQRREEAVQREHKAQAEKQLVQEQAENHQKEYIRLQAHVSELENQLREQAGKLELPTASDNETELKLAHALAQMTNLQEQLHKRELDLEQALTGKEETASLLSEEMCSTAGAEERATAARMECAALHDERSALLLRLAALQTDRTPRRRHHTPHDDEPDDADDDRLPLLESGEEFVSGSVSLPGFPENQAVGTRLLAWIRLSWRREGHRRGLALLALKWLFAAYIISLHFLLLFQNCP